MLLVSPQKGSLKAMNQDELLAQRYGRSSKGKVRERRIATAIAATLLVSFLIWAVAVTAYGANRVTAEVQSFLVIDEKQTEVTILVERPRPDPVVCQVEVLDIRYAVVGYREVTFLSNSSLDQTVMVNTTGLGVTGVTKDCWFK
jgi:Pyruvate/2-oxoacid:ferredoxin oxidoreductase gamma subunit